MRAVCLIRVPSVIFDNDNDHYDDDNDGKSDDDGDNDTDGNDDLSEQQIVYRTLSARRPMQHTKRTVAPTLHRKPFQTTNVLIITKLVQPSEPGSNNPT